MKINKIISIGFLGDQTCYLNISLEEAKSRYIKSNELTEDEINDYNIKIINFNDEFEVYDIWESTDEE